MNDDEALRAAAVNAVNVLVDGVAATIDYRIQGLETVYTFT